MEFPTTEPPLPEQTFFADPAVDRLMGMMMALAAEVYVLRSRVRTLERAQRARGDSIDPDAFAVDDASEREDAAAFVAHLLEPAFGEQQARGPR